ncbi:MAG: hypothetical protein GX346_05705 [Clostridiales bacterium]|nr:hypothetical protein [Clostridiales bacterium]
MKFSEKAAYLKSLAKKAEIETDDSKDKLINSLVEIICDMSEALDNHEMVINDHDEVIEGLCDDFDELGSALMQVVSDNYGDEVYEITCPKCEKVITKEFNDIMDGNISCPNCGAKIEFDFDEIEDGCGCDCGCDHEH